MLAEIQWSQGIEDAWRDIARIVPNILAFLAIVIIGYLIVKAIAKIADKLLERVGFDRVVERSGVRERLKGTDLEPSDVIAKIIFWVLFLIVLQMAFGVFGDNPVSDLLEGVISYLPNVLAAIFIVVIALALAGVAREVIDASIGGLSYGTAVANGVAVAIGTVGVFAALDQLEIAPAIVTGLFYAVLATVVGVTIVAVGGGGIQPMRQRWETALDRLDDERGRIGDATDGAGDRIEARAERRIAQATDDGPSPS